MVLILSTRRPQPHLSQRLLLPLLLRPRKPQRHLKLKAQLLPRLLMRMRRMTRKLPLPLAVACHKEPPSVSALVLPSSSLLLPLSPSFSS